MASSDAKPFPQKNVAYRITFPLLDADGDLVTGAASLDSEVSKDGGTFADCTNEATEIATSSGVYFLDLTSTEMNADTVALIIKTATSGAKTTVMVLYPEEAGDIRVNATQWASTTTTSGDIALKTSLAKTTHITGFNDISTANVATELTTYGALKPTTAGRTLDVTATGEAGIDWANIGAPTTSQTLSGTTVGTVTNVTNLHASSATSANQTTILNRIGTPTNLGAGATLSDNLVDIEGQTDDIGAAGAGLTALGDTRIANLNATVSSRASQTSLDAVDDFVDTEVAAIKVVTDKLDTGLVLDGAVYQWTVNALELGPSGSGASAASIADAVWDEVLSGHLTAGTTGAALNGAGSAGDPWGTALPGAYGAGTAGKIIGDNINATVSSRATPAQVATELTTYGGLKPTTAGRTLDVTATGEAGIDWSNIGAPTTTVNLSGTTVKTATDVETDTADIQSRLPAALVSGRIDASAGAIAANAITATAIATDAITAGKIAADAIGASELAADAVTEIQSGLSTLTATTVRSAVGLASANLDTQLAAIDDFVDTEVAAVLAAVDTEVAAIKAKTDNLPTDPADASDIAALVDALPTATENADALLKRDMSAVTGESSRSPLNALRFLRNKWDAAAGTLTVKKEDDSTTAWTAALSTNPSAEPITGSDPA